MGMGFLKKRKILKSANLLDLVPVRLVQHETSNDGKIKLLVPRFKHKWLQSVFTGKRKSAEFRISLDEMGRLVWLAIDSGKSVADIIENINKNIEEKENSIDGRISAFLTRLYQEDLITFKQLL